MDGSIRINQSRVNSWRTCKQAHYFKYIEQLQPKRPSRPLAFGSLVHKMIEEDANNRDPFEVIENIDLDTLRLFKSEKEEYGDLIDDISIIMEDYWDYWGNDLKYLKIEGRQAEHKFKLDIFPGATWEGKIDAFVQTKNKLKWLIEHKSFNQMPDEDARWRNIQSTTYIRATEIEGWLNVDGILWDYIWSKPPSEPTINKDGSISKRQIKTLPTKLKLWAKTHKVKIPLELRRKAEDHRPEWFQRIYSTKKKKVIDKVWEDFIISAREIVDRGEKEKVKSIGRWCSWCQYEGICRAELTGGDVDFVKQTQYKRQDPDIRYND